MARAVVLLVATLASPTRPALRSLRDAPVEVRIGSERYVLEADLWRDFVHGPKGVGPLFVRVMIMVKNRIRAPASLEPKRVWLLTESGVVWEAPLQVFTNEGTQMSRHATAANGPRLDIDSSVDVVVQFRAGTRDYLIQAKQRLVGKEN